MNDKLVKIQQKLKAPKSEYNKFAGFYFRSAEGILEAVKPLVHAEGLSITASDEVLNIGNANYVKVTVTLTDGKASICTSAFAREEESLKGQIAAQITGGASSYAKKYALNGMFAIDDTKDADTQDNTNHVTDVKTYPNTAPTTPKAQEYLDSLKHQILGNFNTAGLVKVDEQKSFIADLIGKETIATIDEAKEVLNEAQALNA